MHNGFVPFTEVKRAVSLEAVLDRYDLRDGLSRKGANLAGACPFCKGSSGRQFQVNLTKNAWYCFGCKQGGNILDFVAKREGVSVRAAALKLDTWFDLGLAREAPAEKSEIPHEAVAERPSENPPLAFTLKTLDPHHVQVAALGLSPETMELFETGYCARGMLKGRLAVPVHNYGGELVAYVGLALDDAEPRYLFPPDFHPALEVFNLHRLTEIADEAGPLHLVPEVEGVLRLTQSGILSVLGLFDGSLSAEQEEAIAGALSLYERLVLVGEGFADRTVARLARLSAVTWFPGLSAPAAQEPEAPPAVCEEEA
jgi:DNA primase